MGRAWGNFLIWLGGSWVGSVLETAAQVGNTLGKTGMAVGAFIAMILDNTIPGTDKERGLTAWSSEEG